MKIGDSKIDITSNQAYSIFNGWLELPIPGSIHGTRTANKSLGLYIHFRKNIK